MGKVNAQGGRADGLTRYKVDPTSGSIGGGGGALGIGWIYKWLVGRHSEGRLSVMCHWVVV